MIYIAPESTNQGTWQPQSMEC